MWVIVSAVYGIGLPIGRVVRGFKRSGVGA